jgi:hypothetical protein
MEPVTFAFMFLIAVAMGEENKAQAEYIDELQAWNYRLSGELADLAGRENMNNASQQDQIDALVRKVLSE